MAGFTVTNLLKITFFPNCIDLNTVEPVISSATLMSSQPPMGGHLAIPQNDILYANEPPMSSHLP